MFLNIVRIKTQIKCNMKGKRTKIKIILCIKEEIQLEILKILRLKVKIKRETRGKCAYKPKIKRTSLKISRWIL